MQRGFTPIIILVGIVMAIVIAGGAYYFGKSVVPTPQPQNRTVISQTPQPSSTPNIIPNVISEPTPQVTITPSSNKNTSISPLPSATSVSKSVKNIEYSLPSGWKTIVDSTGKLEVGYDASRYNATSKEKWVELSGKWILEGKTSKRLGGNKIFYLSAYSGGSRHNELYKILGENPTSMGSTTKDYSEREYVYNGWKCLVLNGISISEYPVAWGYCPISSTESLVLAFDNFDWSEIE